MRRMKIAGAGVAGLMVAGLMGGCRVESTKNGDGKNVSISTPFGGVQVKTNDADVMATIGLPAYPGAQMVKKGHGNQDGSADVSVSFGGYQLGVQAASFKTTDAPAKVEAFYRDGLRRYGDVIACRNHAAVGAPIQTAEGLACDNHQGGHVSVTPDASRHSLELKAGSEKRQHVVSIDADGAGTTFELVALDLPGKTDFDGGGSDDMKP
jgi:hypothetical protein